MTIVDRVILVAIFAMTASNTWLAFANNYRIHQIMDAMGLK